MSDISPSPSNGTVATLLTASATNGWLDWIHGELWLLPGGLLRIPLDLQTTLLHGMGPTVHRADLKQQVFDEETLKVLFSSEKNVWVPRESIQKAYLHQGKWTDRFF